MREGTSKLKELQATANQDGVRHLPVATPPNPSDPQLKDQLTIQRLSLENRQLQEKLERASKSNEEALNGVQLQVHSLLQEELQKRDYQQLKESHAKGQKEIEQLQKGVEQAKKENEEKQKEIENLVKKLGFVELGKALLPGAISGLAKQYPNQMKGVAGTLGRLGLNETGAPGNSEDGDYLLQILNHLQEVFTEEQFEQVIQLLIQLGEQVREDSSLISKIKYFLSQSTHSPKGEQASPHLNETEL
ncbi:hypothetical protein NBT05_02620 [Aquimarina sp. ERC-38]|uniref:hypothetical protein n=1 Tax=Aquimarina sp. ERC-38 TaxID=2949996 RepID=UPI0022478155|nr:hypothetical protein [Aquimarina sp. ERC-38]UZO81376.1 hypothetical protein NBT05_02620 [Aquimarina sp. ERC-38]